MLDLSCKFLPYFSFPNICISVYIAIWYLLCLCILDVSTMRLKKSHWVTFSGKFNCGICLFVASVKCIVWVAKAPVGVKNGTSVPKKIHPTQTSHATSRQTQLFNEAIIIWRSVPTSPDVLVYFLDQDETYCSSCSLIWLCKLFRVSPTSHSSNAPKLPLELQQPFFVPISIQWRI